MHRKSGILILLIAMLVIVASSLAASAKVAAWDSDKLDQPIAVDGRIRHQENNSYSFVLNNPGIPEEPVVFEAKLNDSIDSTTGTEAGSVVQLFDPEKLRFVTNGFLSYIGAEVTSVTPDTTVYTDNGNVYEGEGNNVDLIEGASARLTLKYNPSYTHQKGAIWYCVNDMSYGDFAALQGGDSCTILGNETTDLTGSVNTAEDAKPKVIRAVSIYDPWFDEMETLYGDQAREEYRQANPDATDQEVAAMTWKTMYLRKTDSEHWKDTSIWRYPSESEISVYTDYLVTVRSPIEMVTFTAKAEYNALGDSTTQQPQYLLYNDQIAHPDMTAVNKIWCYDTSDASAGTGKVDAFRIETKIDPDYDYNLEFEIVQGSAIGTLDFTELDGNTFRFVPKGTITVNGEEKTNYGSVVIKATAEEVNYSKYFTLMYVPSNMKLVKYIGDDMEAWDNGIQIDTTTGLVIPYDEATGEGSGEWDVITYVDSSTNQTVKQLYGMECLVLYPDEVFELAMVQYVDNKDGNGKQPYYMTDGVYTTDFNSPIYAEYDGQEVDGEVYQEGDLIGYEQGVVKYAITYSVTKNDDPDSETIPGVIEFEHYGKVVEAYDDVVDGLTDVLQESQTDTGQSYWYTTNSQKIRALQEGTYYLRYTVSPIEDEGEHAGEISMAESTLTGGVYLYVVSPVNQALANVVSDQNPDAGLDIMLEIPYRISAGQRTDVKDSRGNSMPSHWYLGESKGAIGYTAVKTSGKEEFIYYGSAYGIFEDADYRSTAEDLMNFQTQGTTLVGIEYVNFGDSFLTIYDGDGCRPSEPYSAINEWGGEMAIAKYGNKDDVHASRPSIVDVKVTGAYGLARFPGIRNLRIIDTAANGNDTGVFTEANISTNEDGKKVWDFSSLTLYKYQHANMGKTGRGIEVFYTPQQLDILNIDSASVIDSAKRDPHLNGVSVSAVSNYLGADSPCEFLWGANTKQTLTQLIIGNNSFDSFEVSGFSGLQAVFADGSDGVGSDGSDHGRYLSIHDCSALEYVQANNTAFNYLLVQFPKMASNASLSDNDDSVIVNTMMRANSSPNLYKVNVSGHLTYLELVDDSHLVSVIGSDTFSATDPDYFTMSPDSGFTGVEGIPNASIGGWIRTVNLGSPYLASNNVSEKCGFNYGSHPAQSTAFLHNAETRKGPKYGSDYCTPLLGLDSESMRSGSNNIQILKFNYLYRLFSDSLETTDIFKGVREDEFPDKSKLQELEVFCLVPDPDAKSNTATISSSNGSESHLTTGNDENVYSFDYRHGGNDYVSNKDSQGNVISTGTTILFHHVPKNASINFSDGGMKSIEILDFQGFLNLYMAANIDDLHINEAVTSIGNSTIEMSRSGVKNFSGTPVLKTISVTPSSRDIYLTPNEDGTSFDSKVDSFLVFATPSSFNTGMVVNAKSSDTSVCTVTVSAATENGATVYVEGLRQGTAEITVNAVVSGKSVTSKVTVNVTEQQPETTKISLYGGEDYVQSDGTKIRKITFTTRDDEPVLLELRAENGAGADITESTFFDFPRDSEDNPFKNDDGTPMTYEYVYSNAGTIEVVDGFSLPVVVWSFENTGHDTQEYAEVVLDSYCGNRIYIKPLVDDQTYKGYVSYKDTARGDINFDATFLVEVTGGAERRWTIEIAPSDEPFYFDAVGSEEPFNVSVYDNQLLTNGARTLLAPEELSEDIIWEFKENNSAFTYRIADEALGRHNIAVWVTNLAPGSDVLTASYKNGAVSISKTLVMEEETEEEPDANATKNLSIPPDTPRRMKLMTIEADESEETLISPAEASYSQTFSANKPYEEDMTPYAVINGERIAVNMAGRSIDDAKSFAENAEPRRLMSVSLLSNVGDTTIINARVYKIVANNCPSLEDITISTDQNPATAAGLEILEATGCTNLSKFYYDSQLSMSEVNLRSCALRNVEVQGNITNLYISNNSVLGSGILKIGTSFIYSNGSWSGTDWKAGNRVSVLEAYSCNIKYQFPSNGTWSFRFGSNIPSSAIVARVSLHMKADWWQSAGAQFSMGSLNASGSTHKGGFCNCTMWADLDGSYTLSNVGGRSGETSSARVNCWNNSSGWWFWSGGSSTSAVIYPFG